MATATPTEPKSVSMILKQRQQSRSAGVAPKSGGKGLPGSGTNINESLNPVLPPLYPTAPKSIPLNPVAIHRVKVYYRTAQFLRSNFSVPKEYKGASDGFNLDRYTDQYKSPLTLKSHLLQKLPDSKVPEELAKPVVIRKTVVKKKRRLEDLPDEDADSRDASPAKRPGNAEEEEEEEKEQNVNNLDDDDLEDEFDEEMDAGTDYAMSYFDNGEADDDDRDDEDGPTY